MAGNLSDVLRVKVNLGDLYSSWVSNGRQGVYGLYNDSLREITIDPMIGLDISGVVIPADASVPLRITCELKDSIFIEYPISTQLHFQQILEFEGTRELYGQITYDLNIAADAPVDDGSVFRGAKNSLPETASRFTISPNPAKDQINITYHGDDLSSVVVTIVDIMGRVMLKHTAGSVSPGENIGIPVSSLPRGFYFVSLTDSRGGSFRQKILLDE
jgi:hypothetical protein